MAKTQSETVTRAAVTATGLALLQMIKDAPGGYLALTQAEGEEIVKAGDAGIDVNRLVDDGLAAVRLTPQGEAKLAAATPQAKAKAKSQLVVSAGIDTDVPPPQDAGVKRGRTGHSKFPFDELEIGASFHLPTTEEQPDPLKSMQASLSLARQKFVEGVFNEDGSPKMETVTEKTYDKDENGKIKLDGEGHRIVISTAQVERQVMKPTRTFIAAAVGDNDPKGKGARVWRSA